MADFSALKTTIQNYIKQNGNNEITGAILQQILLSMVTALGDNAINDLVSALGDEISARQNVDGTLQHNIDSEATARSQADGTLQQNINNEASTREHADNTLQSNIEAEATTRGNADTALQNAINAINTKLGEGYVYVGIATTSTNPSTPSGKVFYIATAAGTYTHFDNLAVTQGINIIKNNGSTWSVEQVIAIDAEPTQGSNNLVKSGGVLDSIIRDGSAFDLSAYNSGATYASLSAALTALNALPAAFKKGGMSVKYIENVYAKYSVIITEGLSEQPTGTELSSAPTIESDVYEASELGSFAILPSNVGDTIVYFMAITEIVDEQEVTTYTKWDVRMLVANSGVYKQYRLTTDVWNTDISAWVAEKGINVSYKCLVNQGAHIRNNTNVVADDSFAYSEIYPVESFILAKNIQGNGNFYANILFLKDGLISPDAKVGSMGSSTTPKDISKQEFEAAMPATAKYFTVCSSIASNPYFIISNEIDNKIDSDIENGILTKETHTIADVFLTYQYLRIGGGFIDSNDGSWRRTNYLDLDIYKKIIVDLNGSNFDPVICIYDKNKNLIRRYAGRKIVQINYFRVVIEKTTDEDKFVVLSTSREAFNNNITFYKYANKRGEDFSNCDMRFTEPRTGAVARLITSYTLKKNINDEFLLIFCSGNGGTIADLKNIPSTVLEYFKLHKINIASINHQGIVYGRDNKAWGSDDSYNAHVDLYNYLINEYGFRKDCIISGGSMGGLTMGQLAYKKPFPIRFCLGVGPAPGLKICFDEARAHGYTAIANMMRTVYGLALDGSEDTNFDEASQGHDWRTMGLFTIDSSPYKVGYPNLYIYYGVDDVTRFLFGGAENYDLLVNSLNNAGVYAMSKSLGMVGHANFSAFTQSITDGVWDKELSFEV